MSKKVKWLERKFDTPVSLEQAGELIERLKNTPSRLEALVKKLPNEILTRRDGDSWSIQENAGHLQMADLLFSGRLDDYLQDASQLRPADVSGGRTDVEEFNAKEFDSILAGFRRRRDTYVARLMKLNREDLEKSSLHPRLNKPMRLCDMLYFQAEHDDHHINRIEELKSHFWPDT
jgi:hypothetical protein